MSLKIKTSKEAFAVTLNGETYVIVFVIFRGHEITGHLYLDNKYLYQWPRLKEANQRAADLLCDEFLRGQ